MGGWEAGARGQELRTGGWELGLGARSCPLFSPVGSQEAGSQALSFWQVHGGEDRLSLSR